jgi:DNA primase
MWEVQKYLDENQIQYQLRGQNYFVRCIWHEERSGSLAISRDGTALYCFGCGEGGSLLRYVQLVTPHVNIIEYVDADAARGTKRYAIKDLDEEARKKRELHDLFSAQIQLYVADPKYVHKCLTGALKNAAGTFPICLSQYAWALFFPVYQYDDQLKEDILVGIQRRHLFTKDFDELGYPYPADEEFLNDRPKWQISKNFTKSAHLYGYTSEALKRTYAGIVIVEGIRDKIAGELLYPEYLWLATFGCHLSKRQIKKVLAIHRNRPVIIAYDPDKAGLEGARDAAEALVGKVLLRRGVAQGVPDMGAMLAVTEECFLSIDSNIAPLFVRS